jgi:hypothetical protein
VLPWEAFQDFFRKRAWCHSVSYLADKQGFGGLLDHIGEDNPFHERLFTIQVNMDSSIADLRSMIQSHVYISIRFTFLVCR